VWADLIRLAAAPWRVRRQLEEFDRRLASCERLVEQTSAIVAELYVGEEAPRA
jgi:hypothetical protein